MKRIKYLIYTILVSIVGIGFANAAGISVKANSSSVTVGSSVKVTVSISGTGTSKGSVGAWEYCVSYDSSKLQLTSPSSPCVNDGVAGFSSTSATYTFKVKESGTSKVSIGSYALYDYETEEKISGSVGSASITGKTQSDVSNPKTASTASDNAYLKSLEVAGYELSPSFDKKTYTYEVNVPNDVTSVGINAYRDDTNSTISSNVDDIDHVGLTEGVNKVVITVVAQKGNKLEYTININRAEDDPINVTVNDQEYTVLRSLDGVTKPNYYNDSTVEINDKEVPALVNETTGYTLVALKDSEGNIALYSYDTGSYSKYIEVSNQVMTIVPKDTKQVIKGYENTKEIDINGDKVKVYYSSDDNDFVLLFGMNISNGENSWYMYDIKEGTLQRYNSSAKVEVTSDKDIYFYVAIIFAVLSGVSIITILVLMAINRKLRTKNAKIRRAAAHFRRLYEEGKNDSAAIKLWNNKKDNLDDTAFFVGDVDQMERINGKVEVKKLDEEEEKVKDEKEDLGDAKPPLTARKTRKKTKEEIKKENEEIKAMRDDFLKTDKIELTKEMQIDEDIQKSKRGRKKKQ